MQAFFHWNVDDCILFKTWCPQNGIEFVLSCTALFSLCLVREFLLYVQKYFEISMLCDKRLMFWPSMKKYHKARKMAPVMLPNEELMRNNLQFASSISLRSKIGLRIIDCILYGLTLILGYCMMLVVMTFNVGLIISIVTGYCCGRFILYKRTQLLQQLASISKMENKLD